MKDRLVDAGQMTQRLQFEKITGDPKLNIFEEFFTCWAFLDQASGGRSLNQAEITEENTYGCVTWYDLAIYNELHNDAVGKVRIIHDDGRKFTIASWKAIGEQKEQMRFKLNEQR